LPSSSVVEILLRSACPRRPVVCSVLTWLCIFFPVRTYCALWVKKMEDHSVKLLDLVGIYAFEVHKRKCLLWSRDLIHVGDFPRYLQNTS
jgi:hypothetical protein